MSNLFKILLLYFITASDWRSRCLRFLLCKVLEVSLIIDFLRKSLREEIFEALIWVFYNQFFAYVPAGSNISCSFSTLFLNLCASDYGSKCLNIFSEPYHWFCAKVATEAIAIFLLVYFIIDFVRQWLREQWWFRV